MWKALLAIAAAVLCGAAYLGYENNKSLKLLHGSRVQKEKEVADLKVKLANTIAELEKEVAATEKLNTEIEGLNANITVAKGKEAEFKSQIEVLDNQVASASKKLEEGLEFMRQVPNIEARRQQMAKLQDSIQEEVAAAENLQKQTAEVNAVRDKMQAQADELQALANDQAAGRIRGPFKSKIRKAFNNWGFVIIGAGDEQGVVNRAQLDVTRQGQPICKLLVTTVEPGECVAEIIPNSMAPGQAIQPGDDVTKTELAAAPAAPAGGGVKPPTPELPAGDMKLPPDGGLLPGGADMKQPAGGDAFGTPAPAGGGMKTPAAGNDDPFAPKAPADSKKPDVDSDPFKLN